MCAMRYEDLQRIEIDGWKYVVFEEQCSVGILDGVVADGQKTLVLPERSSDVVAVDKPFYKLPVDTCHLMVPPRLIQKYKNHPHWGKFKQIIPINDER